MLHKQAKNFLFIKNSAEMSPCEIRSLLEVNVPSGVTSIKLTRSWERSITVGAFVQTIDAAQRHVNSIIKLWGP